MNRFVYYLCEYPFQNRNGLIFPNELEKNFYSLGEWYIEIRSGYKNPKELIFDAILKEKEITYNVNRNYRNNYSINVKDIGIIGFKLIRNFERHRKYVGKSLQISKESKIFKIVPVDIKQLEILCKEKGFYFIGRINDRD